MSFELDRLSFSYGPQGVRSVNDVSMRMPQTGLVTVVGPNGAGKSTLLGILAGLRRGYQGSCVYGGRQISDWPRRQLAQRVAFLPQSVGMDFPFTAEEVVMMGRTPRSGGWYESPDDHRAAEQALSITDALAFRKRDFRSLSGGERQRVILASALAQEPETLLLDEPATHLDLRHQIDLYRLLALLGKRMLVIAVTHDLNLAMQFAHHAVVLERGGLASHGPIEEVLTVEMIQDVFGVRATLVPASGGRNWLRYGQEEYGDNVTRQATAIDSFAGELLSRKDPSAPTARRI